LPDNRTWIGSAVIIASGLFVLFREHREHRLATKPNRGE